MYLERLLADKPKRSLAFEAFAFAALTAILGRGLAGDGWGSAAIAAAALVCAAAAACPRFRIGLLCVGVGLFLGWTRADMADVAPAASVHMQPRAAGAGPIDRWRAVLIEDINRVFQPPVSAWVAGLLIGEDSGFSKKWKDVFRATGTSHLTAVSGFNVSVMLKAGESAIKRFHPGRRAKIIFQAGLVAFFVLLTGSPASVLRAAAMTSAGMLAKLAGRPLKPLRSLLLAVLALCLWSPSLLVADRGFQLSALATFGLVTLARPLAKTAFRRWPAPLDEWAGQTAAATAATAPLIAWWTGAFSPVTFVANLAVTAFIAPVMGVGAALAALGFLWPEAAALIAGPASYFLSLPLVILKALSSVPFALMRGPLAITSLLILDAAIVAAAALWWRRVGERNLIDYEEEAGVG